MTSAITELHMSYNDFWNMEPRVFVTLLNEKKEIERQKIKAQSFYTACFIWGKNPDEYENVKKEIPGIDKPVNPDLLRGFYG